MSSIALVGAPMALEGGRPRRIHTKTHRRKHGKSAARKSHKKRSRKHRGGSHSPYPYITAGGKRKMIHRRRKQQKPKETFSRLQKRSHNQRKTRAVSTLPLRGRDAQKCE